MAAVYDFRCSASKWTRECIENWFKGRTKKWTYQLEKGEENGYEHYQGRISLIKKVRNETHLKKALFTDECPFFEYMEPTANTNAIGDLKNDFYVLKVQSRIDGPWRDDDEPEAYIPKQYRHITQEVLFPWQEEVMNITLNTFDDRSINLIYDPVGLNGKSGISAYAELRCKCIDLPSINDFKELMGIMMCECEINKSPKAVFFDLPRAMDKTRLYGIICAMEQIKKGKLYDTRYKYKKMWIDSPHVWIFSNFLIDTELLSQDRWKIWALDNKRLIPYKKPNDFSSLGDRLDDLE